MAVDLDQVFRELVCLSEISKNTRGELSPQDRESQSCASPDCVTLKVRYTLSMMVRSYRCDSVVSRQNLNGTFEAEFVNPYIENGRRRGYHTGNFKWSGVGGGSTIEGQMCGITNAGTHREPLFDNPCEQCDARGHMEGKLEGEVVDGELLGCQVVGLYVLNFDSLMDPRRSAVEGVIEGVLICPCERSA